MRCLSAWVLFLAAGCMQPQVMLCGGTIHNGTGRPLRDVSVVHHPTGQRVTNSTLLPESDFDLGFDKRELKATSATLTWVDPILGPQKAGVQLPRVGGSAGPQWLVYDISASGGVTVRLVPFK